ncbi:MAG TPA: hypothetical protein VGH60_03140 [Solirubrobacteraceae bacterium]
MRVAQTAQKHGIADEDMTHAVRNAIAQWRLDDDFTMRVGPARDGDLLEVGVLGIDTDDPVVVHAMPARPQIPTPPMIGKKIMHTDEEIQRAAKLAEKFDPSGIQIDDTTDLRTLAEAVDSVRTGEARVRELVARARANGRSWGEIGIALGVSRQAARERFAEKISA